MKGTVLVGLATALAMVAGCQSGTSGDAERSAAAPAAAAATSAPADRAAQAAPPEQNARARPEASSQAVPAPAQRKVIRNGTVTLEVKALDAALAEIASLVQANGGYLAGESQTQNAVGARSASLTCRVPAEKLDAVLARLKALGRPEQLSITADDITEQYYNLEIRIRNQKQLETKLLDLLGRQTNKLSDLLEIEREVSRVRGEIDELEGRQRFWDSQVAFSTVTANLHEPRPALAGEEGGIWRTLSRAVKSAGENFVLAIAGIIAVLGWLIPVAVTLVLAFWLLRKLWRLTRRQAK